VERIRLGWELAGRSWQTLRSDGALGGLAALAALSTILLGAAFGIPAAFLLRDGVSAPGVVLAAVGLYVVTFFGVFFAVALAGAASQALDGKDATVADGIAVARGRIGQVAGWAAVLATINLVIQALESRFRGIGSILLGGLQVGWSLVTFLAIPVIALEGTGPWTTLKRSAALFRSKWGEQVTGQVSIGVAVGLLGVLPGAAVGVAGALLIRGDHPVVGGVLLGIGIAVVLVAAVIGTALKQIFAVALYRFATQGQAVGPFTQDELERAVARRPRLGLR
jgi:Family of unknown function (DUF6159)